MPEELACLILESMLADLEGVLYKDKAERHELYPFQGLEQYEIPAGVVGVEKAGEKPRMSTRVALVFRCEFVPEGESSVLSLQRENSEAQGEMFLYLI